MGTFLERIKLRVQLNELKELLFSRAESIEDMVMTKHLSNGTPPASANHVPDRSTKPMRVHRQVMVASGEALQTFTEIVKRFTLGPLGTQF